jgi:transposase
VAEPITGGESSSEAGHAVKLISPEFVKPFIKTNKNDANDVLAIVEAASRPSMNFVPIKQVEQQDIQSIHRIRTRVRQESNGINQRDQRAEPVVWRHAYDWSSEGSALAVCCYC